MALIDFILKAKLSGYASGGEGQKRAFDDGARGFEIAADGYRYLDRYYGFNPFSGAEHIYDADASLIWTMNYYGEVLPEHSAPEKIYAFLREAMLLITPEYPFRGPSELKQGHLQYENIQHGTLDSFHGVESIYEKGERVYFLFYHGGRMIKNIYQ
ncbi:hypothetical protein DSLASN_28460 [Desulfoluna limicola]|uniref:DUF5680 domain-containing protein n=1 Tax=Desulfoluna limicola TaxID=2810562 RepID=A0ABN6F509_9BACT|nr:DUF5680 domain-containing protein [Desulfoluna limicola]BCS97214.1 hypothetical protein DSLASN_28460 [Desulfoluna limicola]